MEIQERNRILMDRLHEEDIETLKAIQGEYIALYEAIIEIFSRRTNCSQDEAREALNDIMQENYEKMKECMESNKLINTEITNLIENMYSLDDIFV